jgi:Galactose oxidase, central domain
MVPSSVRLTPVLLALLIQLPILVGCGGGSGTSTGMQSTNVQSSNPATTYGDFRKTNGAVGSALGATVNMSYPRTGHTATLLADGRVLIAGGNNTPIDNSNFTTYNSAELFDPSTELFSMVPSAMSVARTEQCAVMMPDKRVLMISGGGNYGPMPDLSLVDIFDPATNSFTSQHIAGYQLLPTGTSGNDNLHCFLLPGKRVFIFGGAIWSATASTQMAAPSVLDLTTWTVRPITLMGTDPLLYERYYASAAQAFDGRVFVVGGMTAHYLGNGSPQASADVLVFDPATETMQVVGEMLTARVLAGILAMDDGSIEVYGGSNWASDGFTAQRLTSIERISSTGSATSIGDLALIKLYFTSVMLQNGLSLHVGGAGKDGTTTKTELVFDETQHWSSFTGNMIEERSDYGINMLGTGRVLISGGSNSLGQASDTAEIYEPGSEFYITLPNPVLALGESVQLTPQPNLTVTWSAKLGTVSASGLYTAPDLATWQAKGTAPFDEVTASASDGSQATARLDLLAP